jgi:HEAT repeat protein
VPALTDALDDRLAEASGGYPDPTGPGVLFLHNDLTPCWRAAAAWALGRIADPAATPVLIRVLGNLGNATDTRHAAAVALARTARPADLARLRELAPGLPEVSVRYAVIRACQGLAEGE